MDADLDWKLEYKNGNITKATKVDGTYSIVCKYDNFGRPKEIAFSDGITRFVNEYLPNGKVKVYCYGNESPQSLLKDTPYTIEGILTGSC